MTIGEKIKAYRKSQNMTAAELAEKSGIHPVSIRKYETGAMIPKPEQIKKIADALNISYMTLDDSVTDYFAIKSEYDVLALSKLFIKTGLLIPQTTDNDNIVLKIGKEFIDNFDINPNTELQIKDEPLKEAIADYIDYSLDQAETITIDEVEKRNLQNNIAFLRRHNVVASKEGKK